VIGVESVRTRASGPAGVIIRVLAAQAFIPGLIGVVPALLGVVPGRILAAAPRGAHDPGVATVGRYLRREGVIPVLSLASRCPRVRGAALAAAPATTGDGRQRGEADEQQRRADRDLADGRVAGLDRCRQLGDRDG
jgi:hypothetical protein